jgi:hypothetical protein
MRTIVATIFAVIAAMILMAPHTPSPDRIPAATVSIDNASTLPTQDCMNAVAGADGFDPPTQDCLGSL